MRYIYVVFFALFFHYSLLYSQGEANSWYFGQNAGISFNTTPPTALTNGRVNTLEGCTTISDATGNLLFYTDGITVWDRSHSIMQNGTGLKGDPSSTSSALIVPQPNSPNLYIVFTVDEPHHDNADNDPTTFDGDGVNDGFMYSIVDMSLNGGNGAVVTGQKNIPLITYNTSNGLESRYKCSEKITAVKSDDCDSFWVITHFVDTFYAFKVGQTGVNTTPVTSRIGVTVPLSGYRRNALGYIKASPDGDKIAVAHFGFATVTAGNGPGKVLLYNFDNTTGAISNEVELSNSNSPYGIEFSQTGQRLYATFDIGDEGNGQSFLMQYDLSLPDNQIAASGTRILNQNNQSTFSFGAGAIQLGPDGKIYRTLYDFNTQIGDYLGVIQNPEAAAANIIYNEQGVLVNTDGSRSALLGLPPFIQSIFAQNIDIINNGDPNNVNLALCEGGTYRLSYQNIPGASYTWFVDNNQIANAVHFLDITITANYRLEVDLNDGSCPLIGVANATFFEVPTAIASTLVQCDAYQTIGDNITLFDLHLANDQLTGGNNQYTTQFFIDQPSAQAGTPRISNENAFQNTQNNQQVYARVINTNNTNCFDITTVTLEVSSTDVNDAELRVCDDDGTEDGFTVFDLTEANQQVLSGITNPGLTITYYENTEDALLNRNPITTTTNRTQNTQGDDIVYAKAEENGGECFGISSVRLFVVPLPNIEPDSEYFLCQNETNIEIDAGLPTNGNLNDFTILWSTNESTETILANQPGDYTVEITSQQTGCSKSRTVTVIASSVATIRSIDINDARDNNTVTINTEGLGNYEYAIEINGVLSAYQDDSTFTNVPPGFHRVYVRDKNGCVPVTSQDISVVGFPKYFTPNGDGFHETWNVEGISNQIMGNSLIFIFNRYGKLIKQLRAGTPGWDGTFNGQLMPSSEYWFRVELEDGRILTGSFSLIR
ncbi:gliding motility-associated-like protein [Aquimarina sp. EL_43]|uniref:T9SS type B sorting domain-containing protein n=1 Tax=unclassified Aquimarina TaxID=2627091 RepID=UPI0018CA4DF6|nr:MULTISPECIES: T9SS type B sorting domain-containing protein [unclassified Aquimarina]MBG6132357.1 gliding motility-associated-like protein [Aquimarina sp. EL_35]MBG6152488.1 gliding motility-associated-like protein [Aquimarina sp. EL_32]MBG6170585.1 gliding motility-associated-like protein [Aquimarina sp. EL_43]